MKAQSIEDYLKEKDLTRLEFAILQGVGYNQVTRWIKAELVMVDGRPKINPSKKPKRNKQ